MPLYIKDKRFPFHFISHFQFRFEIQLFIDVKLRFK
nr:MAG TPA: hypothetical protein [Caudoviricetes sp.]